jgi:hypothetical protein
MLCATAGLNASAPRVHEGRRRQDARAKQPEDHVRITLVAVEQHGRLRFLPNPNVNFMSTARDVA